VVVVVVNTGGSVSEPGPAMAAMVRNMAGIAGGGEENQGLSSDTRCYVAAGDRERWIVI